MICIQQANPFREVISKAKFFHNLKKVTHSTLSNAFSASIDTKRPDSEVLSR